MSSCKDQFFRTSAHAGSGFAVTFPGIGNLIVWRDSVAVVVISRVTLPATCVIVLVLVDGIVQ